MTPPASPCEEAGGVVLSCVAVQLAAAGSSLLLVGVFSIIVLVGGFEKGKRATGFSSNRIG